MKHDKIVIPRVYCITPTNETDPPVKLYTVGLFQVFAAFAIPHLVGRLHVSLAETRSGAQVSARQKVDLPIRVDDVKLALITTIKRFHYRHQWKYAPVVKK